jgi:hypothetical protein
MPGGYPIYGGFVNINDQGVDLANTRGTTVVGGANVYGSYVQLVASTPADTCWISVTAQTNGSPNNGNQGLIKLAVGGAGSEVDIVLDLVFFYGTTGFAETGTYSFPISIPAGSRISAACKSNSDTWYVNVLLFDGAFHQSEGAAGVDPMGVSGIHGTNITTGSANAKGSYVQFSASTARDYLGLMVGFDAAGGASAGGVGPILLDIAVGAAGSEVIIVPNKTSGVLNQAVADQTFIPVPVPAGTRLAMRQQNSGGTATSLGAVLYGVY